MFLNKPKKSSIIQVKRLSHILIIIISALLIAGIYTRVKEETPPRRLVRVIHPELRPYVNDFLLLLIQNDIDIPEPDVIIIDLSDIYKYAGVVGIAEGMYFDMICVRIDRKFWSKATDQIKRSLVFHELLHDAFDLKHNSIDMMKPQLEIITKEQFNKQKIELIQYLKDE